MKMNDNFKVHRNTLNEMYKSEKNKIFFSFSLFFFAETNELALSTLLSAFVSLCGQFWSF